jgi:hypothetical protein
MCRRQHHTWDGAFTAAKRQMEIFRTGVGEIVSTSMSSDGLETEASLT